MIYCRGFSPRQSFSDICLAFIAFFISGIEIYQKFGIVYRTLLELTL